jgi:hypothetical protein
MSKTKEELKQIVRDYCTYRGWEDSDANMEEILLYGDAIYEESRGSHRWWNDIFRVVDLGAGQLIGCMSAATTGDLSPSETGWEFDWNSLCEVKSREVTVTVYEAV